MKRDGLMLAALPSGGSDWIATCIAEANPHLRYAREFFCPTINWRMAARLEQTLGDTMFANTARMCWPIMPRDVDALLNDTWRQTSFNFTKENYLPFQLEQFAAHFDVLVLLRSFDETFPPNRHRVMQWYEHFYGALVASCRIGRDALDCESTPMTRATVGYYWFAKQLAQTARKIQAPLLTTEFLRTASREEIARALPSELMESLATASRIVETRQDIPRPAGEYQDQWKSAGELYRRLVKNHGPVIE